MNTKLNTIKNKINPQLKYRQNGMTLLSLLVMVSIGLFIVTTFVKIVPVYIENYSVNNALVSIAGEINEKKIKPKDIKSKLIKRLEFNNVTRITNDQIMISGGKDHSTLSIDYEVRKPIIGNVDFVMKFKNSEAIDL